MELQISHQRLPSLSTQYESRIHARVNAQLCKCRCHRWPVLAPRSHQSDGSRRKQRRRGGRSGGHDVGASGGGWRDTGA
eukprot:15468627-Alexandrium_andersonii.AAC.1